MTVIAGFGDSIIYGSNLQYSWLYRLLDRLSAGTITYTPAWPWTWDLPEYRHDRWYDSGDYRIYNMGIGGNTTANMVARFATDVLAEGVNAEYCIVLGGINDIYGDVALSTIQSNLTTIYAACTTAGIVPIPCTLTPVAAGSVVGERLAELTADIQSLNTWIRSQGYDYIELYTPLAADTATYIDDDGIHPTQAGYDLMAASVSLSLFWDFDVLLLTEYDFDVLLEAADQQSLLVPTRSGGVHVWLS